jgi:thioredoxin reductase (NADPH)
MDKEVIDLDLLILGGGPASLASAIYAAKAKLDVVVFESQIVGGQVRTSYTIQNYPGFKKVFDEELADLMAEQAKELGAKVV